MIHPSSLTCGILLLLCSCVSAGQPAGGRILAKGSFSSIQEAKQEIITREIDWSEFWAKHAGALQPPPNKPVVDFSKEMVIAITLGRQRSGGYTLEIEKIQPTNGKLKVFVTRKSPPPGAVTLQALTAPFCFAATPKTDAKPEFIFSPPRTEKPAPKL